MNVSLDLFSDEFKLAVSKDGFIFPYRLAVPSHLGYRTYCERQLLRKEVHLPSNSQYLRMGALWREKAAMDKLFNAIADNGYAVEP